jgi:DNA-binding transcriptional ArsR family regulator
MPKYVGMVMAQYANRDGTSIRPGVARLVAVTQLSERTVRGALTELRDLGLLRRTREGSSRGRQALTDEYELSIPPDALTRIPMLSPDESPAPGAAVRSDHRQEVHPPPAPGAGTPAPGAEITGRRCTPPNQDQPLDQTNNQRGAPFGTRPTEGARDDEQNNVIHIDRWAK